MLLNEHKSFFKYTSGGLLILVCAYIKKVRRFFLNEMEGNLKFQLLSYSQKIKFLLFNLSHIDYLQEVEEAYITWCGLQGCSPWGYPLLWKGEDLGSCGFTICSHARTAAAVRLSRARARGLI